MTSKKRSFIVEKSPGLFSSGVRYTGSTPGTVAKKVANDLLKNHNSKKLSFSLRETTKGGKKTIYEYTALKEKLNKPQKDIFKTHKIIVKKGGANNNNYGIDKYMPSLIKEITKFNLDGVKKCLERGDDPNEFYEHESSIGHMISNLTSSESYMTHHYDKFKFMTMFKLLVEKGADLYFYMPRICADRVYDLWEYVLSLNIDLYDYIIPYYNEKENLITICLEYGDFKFLKMLADKYIIDYKWIDKNGNSLMHIVAKSYREYSENEYLVPPTETHEKIKFLALKGVDIYLKNNENKSAYDILVEKNMNGNIKRVISLINGENTLSSLMSALSSASCEDISGYSYKFSYLFENIDFFTGSEKKLLVILNKFLEKIDECGIVGMKKEKKINLASFSEKVISNKNNENTSRRWSNEKIIDYVLKIIDIFYSTDMKSSDDKYIRSSKDLMEQDIYREKLISYGCVIEDPAFQKLDKGNPIFSKDADFYDGEMMPVEGTARGEFFYNIRDVDANGHITRAFSKLNFDKLKNNPVTKRDWINTESSFNNRKKVNIEKNNNNKKNNI